MAKSVITMRVKIHWADKWLYLPFLMFIARLGFKFDIEKVLDPVVKRIKVKVV
jgi:hypothetical protein